MFDSEWIHKSADTKLNLSQCTS